MLTSTSTEPASQQPVPTFTPTPQAPGAGCRLPSLPDASAVHCDKTTNKAVSTFSLLFLSHPPTTTKMQKLPIRGITFQQTKSTNKTTNQVLFLPHLSNPTLQDQESPQDKQVSISPILLSPPPMSPPRPFTFIDSDDPRFSTPPPCATFF